MILRIYKFPIVLQIFIKKSTISRIIKIILTFINFKFVIIFYIEF